MSINMIVAIDEQYGIGINNELPWHLPSDLHWFKQNTLGKNVVMGRKTFESIGRPLPDRNNIVLSKKLKITDNILVCKSFKKLLKTMQNSKEEYFIIGGSKVYEQFLPYADKVFLTMVHSVFECDSFLKDFEPNDYDVEFEKRGQTDENNIHDHTFYILSRKK